MSRMFGLSSKRGPEAPGGNDQGDPSSDSGRDEFRHVARILGGLGVVLTLAIWWKSFISGGYTQDLWNQVSGARQPLLALVAVWAIVKLNPGALLLAFLGGAVPELFQYFSPSIWLARSPTTLYLVSAGIMLAASARARAKFSAISRSAAAQASALVRSRSFGRIKVPTSRLLVLVGSAGLFAWLVFTVPYVVVSLFGSASIRGSLIVNGLFIGTLIVLAVALALAAIEPRQERVWNWALVSLAVLVAVRVVVYSYLGML